MGFILQQVLQMPVDIVRGPTVQSFFKPWKNDEDSPPWVNMSLPMHDLVARTLCLEHDTHCPLPLFRNSTFYTPSPHTGRAAVGESVDRTRSLPMSSASSCPPSKPQRSSEGTFSSDNVHGGSVISQGVCYAACCAFLLMFAELCSVQDHASTVLLWLLPILPLLFCLALYFTFCKGFSSALLMFCFQSWPFLWDNASSIMCPQ